MNYSLTLWVWGRAVLAAAAGPSSSLANTLWGPRHLMLQDGVRVVLALARDRRARVAHVALLAQPLLAALGVGPAGVSADAVGAGCRQRTAGRAGASRQPPADRAHPTNS